MSDSGDRLKDDSYFSIRRENRLRRNIFSRLAQNHIEMNVFTTEDTERKMGI